MDIAGLSKLTAETLVLIVSVLGFVVSLMLAFLWMKFGMQPRRHLGLPRKNSKSQPIVLVFTSQLYVLNQIVYSLTVLY